MKPRVSVIIPACNSEKTIANSLDSIRAQSVKPLEIIVVDGGSRDRTREIAERFGARVFVERKKGPAAARNRGARAAKGEIILFTDADCIPEKSWIERMEREIERRGVVGGSVESQSGNIFSRADDISMFSFHGPGMPSRHLRLLVTANLGMKRDIFRRAGGFDESLMISEDTDLCMRINRMGCRSYFLSDARVSHEHGRRGLSSFVRRHYRAGRMGGGINRRRYEDPQSSYRFFPKGPYMLLFFSPALAVASSLVCTLRSARWRASDLFLMPLVAMGKFFWLLGAYKAIREGG